MDGSEGREETPNVLPDAQEAKIFWTDIWGQEEHNKDATWLKKIKTDMNG